MKTINLVLIISAVFIIGALAGKMTGWPILTPTSDLTANTLTVSNIIGPRGINVSSNLRSSRTISSSVSAGDVALQGTSVSGRGIVGVSSSGIGVQGSTDSGYAGTFVGGKGVLLSGVEFNRGAFGPAKGYFVLGLPGGGLSCFAACRTHGESFGCLRAYAISDGSNIACSEMPETPRLCFCY